MEYNFGTNKPQNVPLQPTQYTAPVHNNTALDVECNVLYGADIKKTPIPADEVRNHRHMVGFLDRYNRCFGMTEKMLSKHLLLLGGIGCGKTNVFNFIIKSLYARMKINDIMIVFDTKGDFKRLFYERDNPRHILIGNDEIYDDISRCWNIFDELKDKNGRFSKRSELTAKEIAAQLFVDRGSESQPFFALAAADLVAKVIIHLMRKAVKNHTEYLLSTQLLVSFLKNANHQTYYDMTADPDNPDFVSAQLYFGKPGEKLTPQALGVFGNINSMVNDLFVGVFAENRPAGTYSMRELVRSKGGKIVFIEYDLAMGETLGPMYRLMYDLALKEALGGRQHDGNTYMLADEFKLLPNLMHIDDALNYGRSLGVKVIAGLQSINQLYNIYGEDRGKTLTSGFVNCFCFQSDDYDTRKFISERFGETYKDYFYHIKANPVNVQRQGYSVEDWDILNLDVGQAYIKLSGHKPFLFNFKEFDPTERML